MDTSALNDSSMGGSEKVPNSTMTWRKPSMDLKGHLLYILEQGIQGDMTFLVGEEKCPIKAHRFVLTLWSKAFEVMLDTIEITAMSVSQAKSFLRYLYTEEFDVLGGDLITVLCIARRFEIPALVAKCIAALKREINEKTAVSMYQAAKLLCEEDLGEESLNYILKNGSKVVQEDDFLLLSPENLCDLLKRDDFKVEEIEVFQAICRWAAKQCEDLEKEQSLDNFRLILQDAVKLVRFPVMKSKDFAVHVAPTGILTSQEVISLFTHFCVPTRERANLSLVPHSFVDRERKSAQPPKESACLPSTSLASSSTDTEITIATIKVEQNDDEEMTLVKIKEEPNEDEEMTLVKIKEEPNEDEEITLVKIKEDANEDDEMNGGGMGYFGRVTRKQDWRNPHAGFKFNLMKMLENRKNCDAIFVVGDNKEIIFAHKFILNLWSSVFEGMLGQEADVEPVEIKKDANEFKRFLNVLYTENFDLSVEQIIGIALIAKDYDVAFLVEKCVAMLTGLVRDNTAISIFQTAKVLNDDNLASTAWNHILRRGFAVAKELDFLNINYDNLCTLLEQDDLTAGETQLFHSVLRWGSERCRKDGIPNIPGNLRMVLKKAITLIRFPLMSAEDFSLHVVPTELLSEKEMAGVMVYKSLLPHERVRANSLLSKKLDFNCKERKVETLLVKERIRLSDLTYFSIMADREVTIHGFSFSGMDSSKLSDAPTSLYFYNLKEGMKRATIYEFEITNQTMDKFSITFAKPITIRPGELYISSEMGIGRQGASPVEKETWVSVKKSVRNVSFQFQVHPVKEINGTLEYVVPEVIFTCL